MTERAQDGLQADIDSSPVPEQASEIVPTPIRPLNPNRRITGVRKAIVAGLSLASLGSAGAVTQENKAFGADSIQPISDTAKPWSEDYVRFLPQLPEQGGDPVGGETEMSEVFRRDVLPWITPDADGKFPEVSDDEKFLDSYGGVTNLGLYRNQELEVPTQNQAGLVMQTKILGHEYVNDRLIAYGLIEDPWLGNLVVNLNFGSKGFYTPLHLGTGDRNWGSGRDQKRINTAKMEKFLKNNPGIVVNVALYPYHADYSQDAPKYKEIGNEQKRQEEFAIKVAAWMADRMKNPPVLTDPPEGVFNQPASSFDPENPNAFISGDIIYFKK